MSKKGPRHTWSSYRLAESLDPDHEVTLTRAEVADRPDQGTTTSSYWVWKTRDDDDQETDR